MGRKCKLPKAFGNRDLYFSGLESSFQQQRSLRSLSEAEAFSEKSFNAPATGAFTQFHAAFSSPSALMLVILSDKFPREKHTHSHSSVPLTMLAKYVHVFVMIL